MPDKYTIDDYVAAANVIESFGENYPKDLDLPREKQMDGMLRALRQILGVKEYESLLTRATKVIRRYNNMKNQLGREFPDD